MGTLHNSRKQTRIKVRLARLCYLVCAAALFFIMKLHLEAFSSSFESLEHGLKLTIFVQMYELSSLELIKLQLANFERFLTVDFNYHVVTAAVEGLYETASKGLADFAIVQVHPCPVLTLDSCMDYTFKTILPDLTEKPRFVLHLNIDMFLLKRWSVIEYLDLLDNPAVVAVIEDHTIAAPYLHPGLLLFDFLGFENIGDISFGLTNSKGAAGDTGTATVDFLIKNPHVRVKPMVWSRHFEIQHLFEEKIISEHVFRFISSYLQAADIQINGTNNMAPDLYTHDFAWFHLRDSTCWSRDCEKRKAFIDDNLGTFLDKLDPSTSSHSVLTKLTCWSCSTTVTGEPALVTADNFFVPTSANQTNVTVSGSQFLRIGPADVLHESERRWMRQLYRNADEIAEVVEFRRTQTRLPLPTLPAKNRTNLHTVPSRYTATEYLNDTSFYWRHIYDGTQELPSSEIEFCKKGVHQKYWAITYAAGESRERIARLHTKPSCMLHGVDHFIIYGSDDLEDEYKRRNAQILQEERGKGLWIWKHYVQYRTLLSMNDGDILLYIDSDFRCDSSILDYYCLAQVHDIVGFHHSHEWYTLSRLASRDAMILMDLDNTTVATSVQSSGGNILFRKTRRAIEFVRELASWSQQYDVIGNHGRASTYGVDWAEYEQSGYNHQCDQAVSSLMLVKYGVKTFPWHLEGFGAGSADDLNRAQRRECGLGTRSMSIHVSDNLSVNWAQQVHGQDAFQVMCMNWLESLLSMAMAHESTALSTQSTSDYDFLCIPRLPTCDVPIAITPSNSSESFAETAAVRLGAIMLNETWKSENTCALWCVECFDIYHVDAFSNCSVNHVDRSSTFEEKMQELQASAQINILHIGCSGGCLVALLRRLLDKGSLKAVEVIQFKLDEEVDWQESCSAFMKLSNSHYPLFRFKHSWERWVVNPAS